MNNHKNRLTLLVRGFELKNAQWYDLFQCSCGKKCVINRYNFKKGNTKSCGCLRLELIRSKDSWLRRKPSKSQLTLVTPRVQLFDKNWGSLYRCSCGNEVVLRDSAVKNGNTKSCGCLSRGAKERLSACRPWEKGTKKAFERNKSYIGKRFGNLTVVSITGGDDLTLACACGGSVQMNASRLRDGARKESAFLSCGKTCPFRAEPWPKGVPYPFKFMAHKVKRLGLTRTEFTAKYLPAWTELKKKHPNNQILLKKDGTFFYHEIGNIVEVNGVRKNLKEWGDVLGLTRERVRQIYVAKGVQGIRERL